MNTKKLKEYLSHKTWLWQRIFGHFYLAKHGFKMSQLRGMSDNFDALLLAEFCRNENDLKEFWKIAQYIDEREKNIIGAIEDLRYCRPLSWQYDFVAVVSKELNINLLHSLQLDTLTDAYCLALINNLDTAHLIAELDGKYSVIFASATHKINLLRRNFSLVLDTMMPTYYEDNDNSLNFREIVDSYVLRCGINNIAVALKQAQTPETKLSRDENECLNLAYYSQYYTDETGTIAPNVPGCTIAQFVSNWLQKETLYMENMRAKATELSINDDDNDEEDRLNQIIALKHHPVYVDQSELCLLDVQRSTTPFYANVYIEKFPQDDLNNSLPDFICYSKGWLYTVEFVDNIKQLEIAREMQQQLNYCKIELIRLERSCMEYPGLALNKAFQQRYNQLQKMLSSFYCFL